MKNEYRPLWSVRIGLNGYVIDSLSAIEPRLKGAALADGLVWEPVSGSRHGDTILFLDWNAVVSVTWERAPSAVEAELNQRPIRQLVLEVLRHEKQPMSRRALSERLEVTPGSLTAVLDGMLEDGELVERRNVPCYPGSRFLDLPTSEHRDVEENDNFEKKFKFGY